MRTLLELLRDRRDELQARRLREDFGRRHWLLSWHPEADGSWNARVSCPDWPETVECRGRTRCDAIERASESLAQLVVDVQAARPVAARLR